MLLGENRAGVLRIGEIVVITCSYPTNWSFIRAVCDECEITDQNIVVGQLTINEDLHLYLYGITVNGDVQSFAWDLIVHKLLGCVILFDWFITESFPKLLETLDFLTTLTDMPCVIAADVRDQRFPIAEKFFYQGIKVTSNSRFTYCKSADRRYAKNVLRILIEAVIEKTG